MEGPYQLLEIENAGLGIVSIRRIFKGEIVFYEKPLLLVESKIKDNSYTWSVIRILNFNSSFKKIYREEKNAYLRSQVNRLGSDDKEKFFSLFDSKREKGKIFPCLHH